MARCVYCGRPAGWFRRHHSACRDRHDLARRKIPDVFKGYVRSEIPLDRFGKFVRQIAYQAFISCDELRSLAIEGFQGASDAAMEHQAFSEKEETKLVQLRQEFGLTQDELSGSLLRLAKGAILRDLGEGLIKSRIGVDDLSINLLKDETVLWLFNNCELHEIKTRAAHADEPQGISLRVARGVYVRSGAVKRLLIESERLLHRDNGSFIVTNRSVYFSGQRKSFRLHLRKIVSVRGYSDGIGIFREGINSRPLFVRLNDPWFAGNLLLRLGAM
jgi:hypothetical protein